MVADPASWEAKKKGIVKCCAFSGNPSQRTSHLLRGNYLSIKKPESPGKPFWERKSLAEMNQTEWESLCDGCARCCLFKIEDSDTGELFHTDVVCRYLDLTDGHCECYQQRSIKVPDCVTLTPDNVAALSWMPKTCAYRRLSEGRGLPAWHPLVTGSRQALEDAGISVLGRVISEDGVDDIDERIVDWLDED